MKNLLLITLFTVFAFIATAAEKGNKSESKSEAISASLTGVIVDEITNEPLVGVKVALEGTNKVAYTDFDGNYTFDKLSAGEYKISASYVSYNKVTGKTVKVNGKKNELNLDLKTIK
jgi:hypothetical protein